MSGARKGYLGDFTKAVLRGIWDGFGITDTLVVVLIVLFYFSGQLGLRIFEEHPPAWLVTLIAAIFVAVEVLRSTYSLYATERSQREAIQAKKQPTVPLAELVTRIVGTDDLALSGVPQKVSDALVAFRQKAALGLLSTWGRKGANQSHLDLYPLEPIPSQHWSTAHIDYLQYLKDARCATTNAKFPALPDHYSDIHFDKGEIENIWPTEKSKSKWRSTFVRAR